MPPHSSMKSVTVDRRLVGALGSLLVHVTNLENVLKAVKSDLDDLVVRARQQVTQRTDGTLVNKVANLVGLLETTRSSVGDGPASLLAGLEVTVGKKVDEGGHQVGVDDSLDLSGVASSDVADGPASLLADAILGGAQKREQSGESAAVDNDLGLNVVTSDNVAD